MIIEITGIRLELTYKPIKYLYIQIKNSDVYVRAPLSMTMAEIKSFVTKKSKWIKEKIDVSSKIITNSYADGETVYVLGVPYALIISNGESNLSLVGNTAFLSVETTSNPAEREFIYHKFLIKILRRQLEFYFKFWQEKTGLCCQAWEIRNMKSIWGSCNVKTKKLRFNLNLAKKPPECISYIVLHELVHLKIKGHGQDFKKFMSYYMTDWRRVQKRLNESF